MNRTIALVGNPNVGKSTVFNALTGLRQHTGNWPGKTVSLCGGEWDAGGSVCTLVDLPGTYSLHARSAEEAVTRDYLLSGQADAVIVVCDATCLNRNLFLALQTAEAVENVVLCVNLMDEAQRKGVAVDLEVLERLSGLRVVGTSARKAQGLSELMQAAVGAASARNRLRYDDDLEAALETLQTEITPMLPEPIDVRWMALRLLEDDRETMEALNLSLLRDLPSVRAIREAAGSAESVRERISATLHARAAEIAGACVKREKAESARRLDRLLTGKALGIPAMLLMLAAVLYCTIVLANYPSQALSRLFAWAGCLLNGWLSEAPGWIRSICMDGVWRVLTWVVAVMLPPMAIFFPLFTLLEDSGYLPRVAFNMDRCFCRCRACGKQCLTMMMGLGCNAVGCTGCRIIDSPRERMIALLTNCFMPCNGRFPMLIALVSLFFAAGSSAWTALILTGVILLAVGLTLLASRLLSMTVLRGLPSSFALELPPYRRPQFGQVLVRSLIDRTAKVLGRAVVTAAPAGVLIWILAHVSPGGTSVLSRITTFLDPLGRLLGMDGVMITAFLLGSPANEIVLPVALMAYLGEGTLVEAGSLSSFAALLVRSGWNARFAACVMTFSLMHWPCATTLLTIHKETRSMRWTLLAAALPTCFGAALCMLIRWIF